MRKTAVLLLLALLTACATVQVQRAPADGLDGAERLAQAGETARAADAYEAAAADARGGLRDAYLLRAAELRMAEGDTSRAARLAAEVQRDRLAPGEQARLDILQAAQFLASGDAAAAGRLLQQESRAVPAAQRPAWRGLRADVAEAEGRYFDAAAELALAERGDTPTDARRIAELLARVGDDPLYRGSAELRAGHPLYPHAGRALVARGLPLPRPYEAQPIAAGDGTRPAAEADGYRPPLRIAVLVPDRGSGAGAGDAVRQGILAAHFEEARRRPALDFIATAGDAESALTAYAEAVARGADMVLGPLMREEVEALFGQAALAVPVLALNRSSLPPPPGSVSFSLAPEDEGVAAAERLMRRGLQRVLLVSSGDDSAQRSLAAFATHFTARGGQVVHEIRLPLDSPDYGPALRASLQQIGADGHDAVFMAVTVSQARLLIPQLAVAGLSGRPIVSTSRIVAAGGNDPRLDRELDGVEFPDQPWLLGRAVPGTPDLDATRRQLPTLAGPALGLFGFGMDAMRLSGYLEHLGRNPSAWLNGATGELRLDAFGNVLRAPGWGVFSGGRPRPAPDGGLIPDAGLE